MPNQREPGERVRVIGYTWSPRSHEVRDFLARSRIPYKWLDYASNPEAHRRAEELGATASSGLHSSSSPMARTWPTPATRISPSASA